MKVPYMKLCFGSILETKRGKKDETYFQATS
jgi:hypothetical protein